MKWLTCWMLLLSACAHVKSAPPADRIFDVPLDAALAEAAAVLKANGIDVHPVEGQPGLLVSAVKDWDSSKLLDVAPWQRARIAVMQRSRWLVIGRAIGPQRASVQIVYQVENEVTNDAPEPFARPPPPEIIQRWNRNTPVDRLNAAPVRFEPFEQQLAAHLDGKVAVEALVAPEPDAGVVEPEPVPEVASPSPSDSSPNECGINSEAIDDFFTPGNTLLLGDQLGTKEAPAGFAALVCTALLHHVEVIAALNLPATEQARLNAFLVSDGGPAARAAFLRGPFWNSLYPDGSSSLAVFELIDQLRLWRRAGSPLTVLAIDAAMPGNAREAGMAARIEAVQLKHPDAFTLVFAGNVHVNRNAGAEWDKSLLPLGYRLASLNPEAVLTLDLAFDPGTHWVCRLEGKGRLLCGESGVSPGRENTEQQLPQLPVAVRLVRRFSKTSEFGYDGTWYVGRLSASPPATNPKAVITGHQPGSIRSLP